MISVLFTLRSVWSKQKTLETLIMTDQITHTNTNALYGPSNCDVSSKPRLPLTEKDGELR